MDVARIPPLEPPFDEVTAAALAKMMPPGVGQPPLAIFRTLARRPQLGRRLAAVGGALLGQGVLPLRLRELAILRSTARCGATYEWGVHVSWLAGIAGFSDAQVAATVGDWQRAPWTPIERAVLSACDELHEGATIGDVTFAELSHELDHDAILELAVVAGFYHLISFVLGACQTPLEPWAARPELAQKAESSTT